MPVKKTDLGTLEPLGKGGYGEVFRVGGKPLPGDNTPLAYKEFTMDFDAQRRSARAAVTFRDSLSQADRDHLDQCTVWPRELVLGSGGEISGLLMRLIPDDYRCELLDSTTGKKATKVRDMQWLGATRAQRDAAEIDLRDIEPLERLILLGKLVYAVGRLHKHGWVFGDLSFRTRPSRWTRRERCCSTAMVPPRSRTPTGSKPRRRTGIRQSARASFRLDSADSKTSRTTSRQIYKLGLAILRCLTPGKGVTSTRNPGRLTDQLNAKGIALAKRALAANRADRPTAKELYAYFYEVVSPQVHPPEVRYARLVTPLCARGMDARVEWQFRNAEELTLTVGNADPQTVDLSRHPDGYVIEKPESGPVFIELTNKFGTLRIDLGEITLYDPPKFTPSTSAPCRGRRFRVWTRSPSST